MIRVGIIGCGRISKMHLESIRALPELQLIAICDVNSQTLQTLQSQYAVEGYRDYRELLSREDVDLVSICTPNGWHYPMARDAFLSNKHVLLEKPITLELDEADHLIQLSEEKQLKFFAVKQVRYNPAVRILKKVIDEGYFGKLFSAALVVRWSRPQEYFDGSDWRGTRDMDGGSLLNQGIHYVDVMQWLVGEVKSVIGRAATVNHNIEIEDEAYGLLEFQNGAFATLEFSINTYPHNLECSLTVLGENGTVKLSGPAMNEIELWHVKNFPRPVLPPGLPPNVYAGGLYQGSCPNHIYIYQDIIKYFNNSHAHIIDGKEARKSLAIIKTLYESSRSGKELAVFP